MMLMPSTWFTVLPTLSWPPKPARLAEDRLIRGVAWQRRPQETAHQGNDAHAVHLVYGPPDAELAAETGAAGRGRHAGIAVPLVATEAQLDVEGPLQVGPSLYL